MRHYSSAAELHDCLRRRDQRDTAGEDGDNPADHGTAGWDYNMNMKEEVKEEDDDQGVLVAQ